MNKKEFIKALKKETNYSENTCSIINDILENNFIIGKKNKEKIIAELENKLEITQVEANKIYNIVSCIITNEIKEKLKHPFKSKD